MPKHSKVAVAEPQALEGKTILITRPVEHANEFVSEIESRGGRAVVIPMIHIADPESWLGCDKVLEDLQRYNGIVFTSQNAVERFFRRLQDQGVEIPYHVNVYAVGQRSKEEIEKQGIAVRYVHDNFSSSGLMDWFEKENVNRKRFLLPGGNLNRFDLKDALTRNGALVDTIQVYMNSAPDEQSMKTLKNRSLQNEFDVVTFASPSAVRNFARAISPATLNAKTKVAVIGSTTKEAARDLQFPIDIEAKQPTTRGLVEAISIFYSNRRPEP